MVGVKRAGREEKRKGEDSPSPLALGALDVTCDCREASCYEEPKCCQVGSSAGRTDFQEQW